MIPLSSSCVKLVYVLVLSERRDPALFWTLRSKRCVRRPNYGNRAITVGAERGAERPENRVERSGAVSGRCRKTMERSGARSGGSRSGNGAGSGGYRIRLERGAAFSPAPLRSHALVLKLRYFSQFKQAQITQKCHDVTSACTLKFGCVLDFESHSTVIQGLKMAVFRPKLEQ